MSVDSEQESIDFNIRNSSGNGYRNLTEPVVPKLPKSIAMAINGVMGDIKTLKKEDENKFQHYSYASIDNFLKAVNPLCAKHGLIINIDEESCEVTRDGAKNPWMHIVYKFILSHSSGDTWGYTPRRNMFVSMTGGQSMGSAMSYTLKQFMRSLFQIPTGEKDDLDGHNQDFGEKNGEKRGRITQEYVNKLKKKEEKKKDDKTPQHTTQRRTG